MEMLGVPALIFALGMYLPLELNTPALVGGFLAHFLGKRSERVGGERGAVDTRARRDHRLGLDGRRRARRRVRRGLPPDSEVILKIGSARRSTATTAVSQIDLRAAVRRPLPVSLVRLGAA